MSKAGKLVKQLVQRSKKQAKKQRKEQGKIVDVHHLIVLDESGSMDCVWEQTISGCNETIQTIKKMQEDNAETQCHWISIYAFDDRKSRYIIEDKLAESVQELTPKDYCPRGLTPLYDAMGFTLSRLSKKMIGDNVLGYTTIITDGMENASTDYTLTSVRNLIDDLKKRNVIFSFIGANIDAKEYAESFHISSSLQFDQSDEGMDKMWRKERISKLKSMERFQEFMEADVSCCCYSKFAERENLINLFDEED